MRRIIAERIVRQGDIGFSGYGGIQKRYTFEYVCDFCGKLTTAYSKCTRCRKDICDDCRRPVEYVLSYTDNDNKLVICKCESDFCVDHFAEAVRVGGALAMDFDVLTLRVEAVAEQFGPMNGATPTSIYWPDGRPCVDK